MARRKSSTKKIQPAVTSLWYQFTADAVGVSRFLDIASDLSRLNRRLYSQGMQYAIAGVTVTDAVGVTSALEFSVSTAGNTWIIQNAYVKGKSLWNQMNQEVIDDNPSVQGKWADFKIALTENMAAANTLQALDGSLTPLPGNYEWAKSTYVVPQHDVDAAGVVLPAEEYTACLLGPDDLPNGVFSLVKAYEDSRSTVQDIAPNVPIGLPNSFYLQLTDDGSQDPELAAVIIDQNDQPPYSMDPGAYPGGNAFTVGGATTRVARGVKNDFTPVLQLHGFTAECGLMRLDAKRSEGTGVVTVQVHLAPGTYKGVMAKKMGQ